MRIASIAILSLLLFASLVLAQAVTDVDDNVQVFGENLSDENVDLISEEAGNDSDLSEEEDDSEDDDSNMSEEELAQLEEEGKIYGNYCGPDYCGGQSFKGAEGAKCLWNVKPKDSLDACCQVHDQCCGTPATRGVSCNRKILECVKKASCRGVGCKLAKAAIKATFTVAKNSVCGELMNPKNLIKHIGKGIKNAAKKVGGALKKLFGRKKKAAKKVGGAVKNAGKKVGGALKKIFGRKKKAAKKVGGAVKKVSNSFKKAVSKVSKKASGKVSKKGRKVSKKGRKVSKKGRKVSKRKAAKRPRRSSSSTLGSIIKRYRLEKYVRGINLGANPRFAFISSKLKRSGGKPSPRVRKATRKLRSWIRRKFGGNKKRVASFLRRKFRGNRLAQKKWERRTFGAKVSIRKALRPRSGRKPSRRNSGSVGPKLRIIVKHASKSSRSSQPIRLCTRTEISKMKGPKPKKCIVVFDLQHGLEIAKQANSVEEDLEDVSEDLD